MKFEELGLTSPILRAIDSEGYSEPTPIQVAVIPKFLEGNDIVGVAQTGTGKTAAFVLPILERLVKKVKRNESKCFPVLVLVPTRELAMQIVDKVRTYGSIIRPKAVLVVGGAKPGPQIKALKDGADIVVATPGRLLDHVTSKVARLDLTSTVVLDEADQMLDLGFMPSIKKIMSKISKDKQAILLSATMPKAVRALADEFLHKPKEVNVAPSTRPIELIDQRVFIVKKEAKLKFILDIFNNHTVYRSIIFVRTKMGANKLAVRLKKSGIEVDAIHGDKSQSQRTRTLKNFRLGKLNILIATDIAARGIDVDDISHVINYDMPNEAEIYIHRIGRTARAGKSGIAISLCDVSEKRKLKAIEKLIGYSLYGKILNESEDLILGDSKADFNKKLNYEEGHNDRKRDNGFIKSKSSAKKFTKKAKKRFADKYSSEERRPRRDSEDRNSRPSFAKRGERSFGDKPKGKFEERRPRRDSEERRPRRDSEDRNSRPSFAKRGENKSFKKVNKSKKRTSVKKNSSTNKSSINLNDSYNGS
ncbi:DEAD/DEAH box helicase [Alphaproteobacteria bacterium]|nr:DEAD/DEAH box helicase [Alphaproteobacteria bacterium]